MKTGESLKMELKQAGEKTYYIEHDTNIGVYVIRDNRICIIDTGEEGDGEKIDEIIMAKGWEPEYILNTHTHIDHIGGNKYLMGKYGIPAFCSDYDMTFAHYSELEVAYMNGGYPTKKLRKVFAHPGKLGFRPIENMVIEGMDIMELPGHSFGMIGFRTSDDVWFLGDSYLSRDFLNKFHFGFIYNIGAYLETLDRLKELEGSIFIPSHGVAERDIKETVAYNVDNMRWMLALIKDICKKYKGLDGILQQMYERLGIRARATQQVLLSSTTKSYLSYLEDIGELECKFIDNVMKWKVSEL